MQTLSLNSFGDFPALVSVPHAGLARDFDSMRLADVRRTQRTICNLADSYADVVGETIAQRAMGQLLGTDVSRVYCDVERYPDEREEMNAVGMGVVYTRDENGDPIYRPGQEPDDLEVRDRMAEVYWPYHAMLTHVAQRMIAQFGQCVLLDVHTYSDEPWPYELHADDGRPQVCLGHNGDARGMELAIMLGEQLEFLGLGVGLNEVFKGSIVPNNLDDPKHGLASVMIEMRKSAARDEGRLIAQTVAKAVRDFVF
jgi:N-formylglutamate amidohydrolase